jgi:hypothetical protein
MTETRLPSTACSSCGYVFDAVSSMYESATPKDGDVSMCISCGQVMVFTNGKLRNPTYAEMLEIVRDMRMIQMQKMRAKVMTRREK